jgi:hypothetical protein
MSDLDNVQRLIEQECNEIKEMLLQKNKEYGNSAFYPKRIFSKANAIEQIKVRIDDKISRLSNSSEKSIPEDTVKDLIGYLVILRVAEKLKA